MISNTQNNTYSYFTNITNMTKIHQNKITKLFCDYYKVTSKKYPTVLTCNTVNFTFRTCTN